LGGNVLATLRKGDSVIVSGKLLYRSYDDAKGNRQSRYEIDALGVGPDLNRCPADIRRPERSATPEEPTAAAAATAEPPPAAEVAA
jgi:single-strand DNA-binding protein